MPVPRRANVLAFIMLFKQTHMKQNADNIPDEAAEQEPELRVLESPRTASAGANSKPASTRQSRQSRPEIAVLGWNVRFYRLALRQSKI